MKRDAKKAETLPDLKRIAVGLPIGVEGGYFVGSEENFGQNNTPDVLNHNEPPQGQPGLWCQWTVNDANDAIEWDCGEKFYSYVEWLQYLIEHFLKPWGYTVNGTALWSGEESDDQGAIEVVNNRVGTRAYELSSEIKWVK
jgi:hypothetical protein